MKTHKPRPAAILPAVVMLLFYPVHTRAAEPFIETFSTAMNGWTNTAGTVWRTNSGTARVSFPNTPLSELSTLTATGAAATAAYTGDYVAAGIRLFGFKFRADSVLPVTLETRLLSGTNGYFKALDSLVTTTGVWHQFLFSLEGKAVGGWAGSDDEIFDEVLSGVDRIEFTVAKPAGAAIYRIDDIVIDRLHAAAALTTGPGGAFSLSGDFLQTNVTYLIEATPELTGVWTTVQSLLATNRSMSISLTNAGPQLFWRLAIP